MRALFPIIKPKDPARKITLEMIAKAESQLIEEEAAKQGNALIQKTAESEKL